ncbi:MAG TPA: hypothetical protein ENJ15_04030 [Caldithrix abyssi]|uniref:Adenosyl-chloride synthase n=1 Tax=Caldithrix abyssi TaxID=187145 RepID=A0A7V5RP50_CALAY|nr:hypothetical protein [Caldithrix abyssi]
MSTALITLLTDFGTRDGYVGSCKGVIRQMAPGVEIIDISHDIPPFGIREASLTLYNYYDYFPRGAVHLAVVDPGVGSDRGAVILRTAKHTFVGPDNGLFRLIMENEAHTLYAIDTEKFLKGKRHYTFHGRDMFAPVAARLAMGEAPETLGRKLPQRTDHGTRPFRKTEDGRVEVPVLSVDHFGNIIFAFNRYDMERLHGLKIKSIMFKGRSLPGVIHYYGQAEEGGLLALWNSRDFLELAINGGHAANALQVDPREDILILELE